MMQRAQFHRPFLRITLATAVAVLMGTTLVACERRSTEGETTTAAPAGDQNRDDRAGEVQPSGQQATGQQSMGQGQMAGQGQGQTGMGGQAQGQDQGQAGMGMGGQGQMGTGGQDVMAAQNTQGCPMMVQNASIEVEETGDGVAMRFTTTTTDNVQDLRKRVEQMARMYETHGGGQGGSTMWHPMGHMRADQDQQGAGGQGPAGAIPAATTRVEEIDNGARLVLTPKDKAQLASLREHVRDHQRRMKTGECWMATSDMGGQGGQGQTGGASGRTGGDQSGNQDKPGHRPGESAPGDGRPKT